MKKDYVEPHIYTQEEAEALKRQTIDLNCEVCNLNSNIDSLKSKLDIALEMMSKEQLIEFIHKTM